MKQLKSKPRLLLSIGLFLGALGQIMQHYFQMHDALYGLFLGTGIGLAILGARILTRGKDLMAPKG